MFSKKEKKQYTPEVSKTFSTENQKSKYFKTFSAPISVASTLFCCTWPIIHSLPIPGDTC